MVRVIWDNSSRSKFVCFFSSHFLFSDTQFMETGFLPHKEVIKSLQTEDGTCKEAESTNCSWQSLGPLMLSVAFGLLCLILESLHNVRFWPWPHRLCSGELNQSPPCMSLAISLPGVFGTRLEISLGPCHSLVISHRSSCDSHVLPLLKDFYGQTASQPLFTELSLGCPSALILP